MKRRVLQLVFLSLALVALGYASAFRPAGAPPWAAWCLAIGSVGAVTSLMALGALRADRIDPSLRWVFAGMFVLCAGAFVAALVLPAAEGAGGPIVLGLPLRTAIVVYGVGVLPIAILPFAYALTFDRATLTEADIERVRAARDARRLGTASGQPASQPTDPAA